MKNINSDLNHYIDRSAFWATVVGLFIGLSAVFSIAKNQTITDNILITSVLSILFLFIGISLNKNKSGSKVKIMLRFNIIIGLLFSAGIFPIFMIYNSIKALSLIKKD